MKQNNHTRLEQAVADTLPKTWGIPDRTSLMKSIRQLLEEDYASAESAGNLSRSAQLMQWPPIE